MNKKIFFEIFKINLLYANSKITSIYSKKKDYIENPKKLYKKIFLSNFVYSPLIMLVFYSVIFFRFDFKQIPIFFDVFYLFFMAFAVIQSFSVTYSIFYASKDLEAYKPLPIDIINLLKSKVLIVFINIFTHTLSTFVMLVLFYFKNGFNILEIVLYSILIFTMTSLFLTAISIFVINVLIKTIAISKIGNSFITFVDVFAILINIGIFTLLKFYDESVSLMFYGKLGIISGLISNRVYIFPVLVFLLLTSIIVCKKSVDSIGKTYFEDNEKLKNSVKIKKYKKSKLPFFIKYNFDLIFKDSSVISSAVVTSSITPVFYIFPAFLKFNNINQVNNFIITVGVAGLVAVCQYIYPSNLSSIIISLDRENFKYIKSLPIDMSKYMINKLFVAVFVNGIIPLSFYLVFTVYFKLNMLSIICGLFVYVLIASSLAINWMMFDYKNLLDNWQNITELMSRVSNLWTFIIFIIIIAAFGLFMFLFRMFVVIGDYILMFYAVIFIIIVSMGYLRFKDLINELEK